MLQGHYLTNFLETIARGIGISVKIDSNTFAAARALYARMCVEIDLHQPLVPDVTIRGECFKVQYEGLHTICMSCGTYGHEAPQCPSPYRPPVTIVTPSPDEMHETPQDAMTREGVVNTGISGQPRSEFGEWMVAIPSVRQVTRSRNSGRSEVPFQTQPNRYVILADATDTLEVIPKPTAAVTVADVMKITPARSKWVRVEKKGLGPLTLSAQPKSPTWHFLYTLPCSCRSQGQRKDYPRLYLASCVYRCATSA
ncbi:hypothetical protein Tsubulata_013361 [Turnera subulata]|uniref:CCHC-type domain-containing protein n=1 Tax=Turnera subulata TaxID=218843 RepID=A0A9Q0JIH6_9ROSI|nr:hypothetical protein Tsubulata_013361 [Turnera subulata]